MKATSRKTDPAQFRNDVQIREHHLIADEPRELGGRDEGPSPQELLAASLASCTAMTMDMYAKRKGWEIGRIEVECEYETAERGSATTFRLLIRLPSDCTEEQIERLRVIGGRCPVHRVLEGPVTVEDSVELAAA